MMTNEAEQLIQQWHTANDALRELPKVSQDALQASDYVATLIHCSIELGKLGYIQNEDETDWIHPSEAN